MHTLTTLRRAPLWLKLASGSVLFGALSGFLFTYLVDYSLGYAISVGLVYGLASLAVAASLLFVGQRIMVLIIGGVPLWMWAFALGVGGVDPTPILPALLYGYSVYSARSSTDDHRALEPVR